MHEGVILKDQLSAFCYYRIPSYDCISLGMEDATWEMVKRRYDQGSKKLSPNVVRRSWWFSSCEWVRSCNES